MELRKRINVWLQDTSRYLDLTNLNLAKFPIILKDKKDLIVRLNCSYNLLRSLPCLANLKELICYKNKLSSIPFCPKLKILYC